ncbi:MAG: hypothetical protein Q3966_08690 [Neisseria sp.]|nr:hypothetical protein [Neisseria sp.]
MSFLTTVVLCSLLPGKTAEAGDLAEYAVRGSGDGIYYVEGRLKNTDSALAVYKTEIRHREGGEVQVLVKTTLARCVKSINPQYFHTPPLDGGTTALISFGKDRKVIWHRPQGFPDSR